MGRRGTLFAMAGAALGLVVGTNTGSNVASQAAQRVSNVALASRKFLYDRVLSFGKRYGARAVASEELSEWIVSQNLAIEYPEIAAWLAAQETMREGMTVSMLAAEASEAAAATVAAATAVAVAKDREDASSEKENDGMLAKATGDGSTSAIEQKDNCVGSDVSSSHVASRASQPILPTEQTTRRTVDNEEDTKSV